MSERDQILAMLTRAGVPYTVDDTSVTIEVPTGKVRPRSVCGYTGFFTVWRFTSDGALEAVEVWE